MGLGSWVGLPLQALLLLSNRVNPQGYRGSGPGLKSPVAATPGHHIEHMFSSQQAFDPEGRAAGLDGMTVRSARARSPWDEAGGNVVLKRRMISWQLPRRSGGMIDE